METKKLFLAFVGTTLLLGSQFAQALNDDEETKKIKEQEKAQAEYAAKYEARYANEIYVQDCASADLNKVSYCLDKKGHIASPWESKNYNDEGQLTSTEMKTSKSSKKDLYSFFTDAVKTPFGKDKKIDLFSGLKLCSDTSVGANQYCMTKDAGSKKNRVGFVREQTRDEDGKITNSYYTLNRNQLLKYVHDEMKFDFITEKRHVPLMVQPVSLIDKVSTEKLQAYVPKTIEMPKAIKDQMEKIQKQNDCVGSAMKYLSGDNKDAKEFMAIQTKLTTNRLYYIFMEAASRRKKDIDFKKEQFGVKSAILALLKEKGEHKEAADKFEKAPISNIALSEVIPELSEVLEANQFVKDNPELQIGDSDIKMLSWIAESQKDAQKGDKSPNILNLMKFINGQLAQKDLNIKDIKAARAKIAAENKKLESDLSRKVEAVLHTKGVSCDGTQDCELAHKQIKNFQSINYGIYKSLNLRKSDLPNVLADKPKEEVRRQPASLGQNSSHVLSSSWFTLSGRTGFTNRYGMSRFSLLSRPETSFGLGKYSYGFQGSSDLWYGPIGF